MKKVLERKFVSLINLQTIDTKIEDTLNDRPSTYMSADVRDPEPFTSAHLQYGHRIVLLLHCTFRYINDPHYGALTTANI